MRIVDAGLKRLSRGEGANFTMAQVAAAARVSRQAVYLHFKDRTELLIAMARRVDEQLGIPQEVGAIADADSPEVAIRMMVSLQARLNPRIWPAARAMEAVRRTDPAVESAWQDRLQFRLEGCRRVVARLQSAGRLRSGLDADAATDILWSLTSLRTWEDLVLQRGWTSVQYEDRVTFLLLTGLIEGATDSLARQ
jgi:AcrR family transcriptional regulator